MPPEKAPLVLLADDNPFDVRLILHAFRPYVPAHRIHVANDGVEALAYLQELDADGASRPLPRVALLDIKMPRLTGIEVVRALRASAATADLPLVILTSSGEARDRESAQLAGATDYVVKPVEFAEMRDVIGRLCRRWLISPTG